MSAGRIAASFVSDIRGLGGNRAGAMEIRCYHDQPERVAGFAFRCPCGCGHESWLPVRLAGSPDSGRPEWEWDGNRAAPSLSPSILQSGLPCKWHGYLKNGVFEPC